MRLEAKLDFGDQRFQREPTDLVEGILCTACRHAHRKRVGPDRAEGPGGGKKGACTVARPQAMPAGVFKLHLLIEDKEVHQEEGLTFRGLLHCVNKGSQGTGAIKAAGEKGRIGTENHDSRGHLAGAFAGKCPRALWRWPPPPRLRWIGGTSDPTAGAGIPQAARRGGARGMHSRLPFESGRRPRWLQPLFQPALAPVSGRETKNALQVYCGASGLLECWWLPLEVRCLWPARLERGKVRLKMPYRGRRGGASHPNRRVPSRSAARAVTTGLFPSPAG
jgi:hypothetical protein